jgi:ribosomal protein L37AE/L43A
MAEQMTSPVPEKPHGVVRVEDHGGWEDVRVVTVVDLPAGPIPGKRSAPRVAGSRGAPVPVNLTAVDLSLPARQGTRPLHARAVLGLDEEQVGDLSVATVLETLVIDIIGLRGLGEHRPEPSVDALTRWLADRVEWVCDHHPDLPQFADDLRDCRAALRRALGLVDRDDYKEGVACPKCAQRTLSQRNGHVWVECAACNAMLSPDEYGAATGVEADAAWRTLVAFIAAGLRTRRVEEDEPCLQP